MRQIALDVLKHLELNYTITLISCGENAKYELVILDRPRNSYFSIRLRGGAARSAEHLAQEIEGQLRQRLTALDSGADSGCSEQTASHPDRAHT